MANPSPALTMTVLATSSPVMCSAAATSWAVNRAGW